MRLALVDGILVNINRWKFQPSLPSGHEKNIIQIVAETRMMRNMWGPPGPSSQPKSKLSQVHPKSAGLQMAETHMSRK